MHNNYNSILFDLDGTLTLPELGIVNSVQYALSKYGIDETNREKLTAFIGPSLYESFQKFYNITAEDAVKCVEFYREYYMDKGITECRVMPGMEALLKDITAIGIPMYVATGKPTLLAEKVLKNYNLFGYFQTVVGSNFDGTRQQKYEVIEATLPFVKGDKPVMIGDREHDIEGANKNSIESIAITFGYGKRNVLESYNPTYIVDSIDEIRKIII